MDKTLSQLKMSCEDYTVVFKRNGTFPNFEVLEILPWYQNFQHKEESILIQISPKLENWDTCHFSKGRQNSEPNR